MSERNRVTHDLKPYPAYKDSGLPWLGEVPEHWEIQRGKTVFNCVDVRSSTGQEELLTVSSQHGVIPRKSANVTMFKAESYTGHKLCWPNDLVINSLWAWARGLGVSQYHGIISSAYGVYRLKPEFDKYAQYMHQLVRSAAFQWELQVRSKGIWTSRLQLTDDAFLGAPFPLPPVEEQAAIVRSLNYMDQRIRRYIRAKQKLIKLLEEQKQSIIHQAVTGQIDVRTGQPYPAYKPSGVEWFSCIPERWNVRRTRRLFSFVTSGSRGWASYYSDDGDIFIQSGNLGRSMALDLSRVQHVKPPASAEGIRTKVQQNDVLICITGALTGNVIFVNRELPAPAFVNQHVALCRPKKGAVTPRFLAFALHADIGQTQFKTNEYGGTKQGLGLDEVKNVVVPLPSDEEQTQICDYLDKMVERTERAKQTLFQEIAAVREYHTSLIADVVTGKLDVRQAAAELPEEVEELELLEGVEDIDADAALEDDLDEEIEEEAA